MNYTVRPLLNLWQHKALTMFLFPVIWFVISVNALWSCKLFYSLNLRSTCDNRIWGWLDLIVPSGERNSARSLQWLLVMKDHRCFEDWPEDSHLWELCLIKVLRLVEGMLVSRRRTDKLFLNHDLFYGLRLWHWFSQLLSGLLDCLLNEVGLLLHYRI